MKKVLPWIFVCAVLVALVTFGLIGIRIYSGDYEAVSATAYVCLGGIVVMFVCLLYRNFSQRCPHCGRLRGAAGRFCPHCGKEITRQP